MTPNWIAILILLVSLGFSLAYYFLRLQKAVIQLPQIAQVAGVSEAWLEAPDAPRIAVVIPMYNEEENLDGCVRSVLASSNLPASALQVWVIDDQSTDRTLSQLRTLQAELSDARLRIVAGEPRPADQLWTGKNWACHQAAQQIEADWLLFLDADVRLKPGAIAAVVQMAIAHHADLLTCIPQIVNGSLVEWLVQPQMFANMLVAFNDKIVRDPKSPVTYAVGWFLLFSRKAYQAVGGHASIAADVAEDVAFARTLKHQGYNVFHLLGTNVVALRMYRSFSTLWEGWTKVLYVGTVYNWRILLVLITMMLAIYTVPWLGFAIALVQFLRAPEASSVLLLLLSLTGILLQYRIRVLGARALGTTTRYWWLQSLSGLLISALAIASIIKTQTGWGWTWRGRSLKPLRR